MLSEFDIVVCVCAIVIASMGLAVMNNAYSAQFLMARTLGWARGASLAEEKSGDSRRPSRPRRMQDVAVTTRRNRDVRVPGIGRLFYYSLRYLPRETESLNEEMVKAGAKEGLGRVVVFAALDTDAGALRLAGRLRAKAVSEGRIDSFPVACCLPRYASVVKREPMAAAVEPGPSSPGRDLEWIDISAGLADVGEYAEGPDAGTGSAGRDDDARDGQEEGEEEEAGRDDDARDGQEEGEEEEAGSDAARDGQEEGEEEEAGSDAARDGQEEGAEEASAIDGDVDAYAGQQKSQSIPFGPGPSGVRKAQGSSSDKGDSLSYLAAMEDDDNTAGDGDEGVAESSDGGIVEFFSLQESPVVSASPSDMVRDMASDDPPFLAAEPPGPAARIWNEKRFRAAAKRAGLSAEYARETGASRAPAVLVVRLSGKGASEFSASVEDGALLAKNDHFEWIPTGLFAVG